MTSWQSGYMSFSNIMPHLLETQRLADVIFIVGNPPDQKEFKAHKLLLAIRSNVFKEMFYGSSWLEKKEEIAVPDIKPEIFELMLVYIYTEKVKLESVFEAAHLYFAASKYNLVHVLPKCYEYVEKQFSVDNVCIVYEMALHLSDGNLEPKCEELILQNPTEAIESEGFTLISLETIQKIFNLKYFKISSEPILFRSLFRWTKCELRRRGAKYSARNLRGVIDPLLPHVTFHFMSHNEFFRGPAMSGVLTNDEIAQIGMNISLPGCVPLPDWCNKERDLNPYKVLQLYHECSGENETPCYDTNSVECRITVIGKDIMFNGLSIYAESPHELKPIFYINSTAYPFAHTTYVHDDKDQNVKRLIIAEPFLMKQNVYYYVKLSFGSYVQCCRKPIDSNLPVDAFDVYFMVDYVFKKVCPKFYNEKERHHFQEILFTNC